MFKKMLRNLFVGEPVAKKEISAELKGCVLHMYYPLSDGDVVHKQMSFPNDQMAQEGYHHFMQNVVARRPGHAQRRHLHSVRLNNELIEQTDLPWVPSDVNGRGPASLS